MFLNFIGLLYIEKIVIVSYIIFLQGKFQYIKIFSSFLMTQIGTEFYVFKLYNVIYIPKLIIVSSISYLTEYF